MADQKIINKLKKFKKELEEEMPNSRMILFGSRAWGKPHRDSDIDLIIINPKFKKERGIKRGMNLYKLWSLDYPVDFLCYTPEEFKRLSKSTTLMREAAEKGIEI